MKYSIIFLVALLGFAYAVPVEQNELSDAEVKGMIVDFYNNIIAEPINTFVTSVAALGAQVGLSILGAMGKRSVVEIVEVIIDGVVTTVTTWVGETIQTGLLWVGQTLVGLQGKRGLLGNIWTAVVETVVEVVETVIETVIDTVETAIDNAVTTVTTAVGETIQTGLLWVGQGLVGLQGKRGVIIDGVVTTVTTAIGTAVQSALLWVGNILVQGKRGDIIDTIVDGIVTTVTTVIGNTIQTGLLWIGNTLVGLQGKREDDAKSILYNLVYGVTAGLIWVSEHGIMPYVGK